MAAAAVVGPGAVSTTQGLGGGPTCPDFGCGMNHNQVLL